MIHLPETESIRSEGSLEFKYWWMKRILSNFTRSKTFKILSLENKGEDGERGVEKEMSLMAYFWSTSVLREMLFKFRPQSWQALPQMWAKKSMIYIE